MSDLRLNIANRPHVIIRASAGSGKTYQLSNRYVDLLLHHAAPSNILATTFTRKAAGEILSRILRRLAEAVTDDKERRALAAALDPDGKAAVKLTAQRAGAMLLVFRDSIHRAAISTIDSFFHRIASGFRFELHLPPDPVLVEATDARAVRLRQRAIEAMLADADVDVLIDLLKRLHHDQTRRKVTQAIDDIVKDLYDLYRITTREAWSRLPMLPTLDAKQVADALTALDDAIAVVTQKRLGDALIKSRTAVIHGDWSGLLSKGVPAAMLKAPDDPRFYDKPVESSLVRLFRPLIDHAIAVQLNYLARQTQATYDLLERFDRHYARLRDEHRLLLYSDLPHKLAHELPRGDETLLTEICYRLDGVVSHLLLDEFQDTSFDQWRVLSPFAEEVTSHADVSRTFFCVGDVKQAIYGWRGGRAELFRRIPDQLHLESDAQVTLDVSHRTAQAVLDVVNQVFDAIDDPALWSKGPGDADEVRRWTEDFRPHRAFKTDLRGHVAFITSPAAVQAADVSANDPGSDGDDDESSASAGHLDFAADVITRLHRAHPSRTIGVLVTTNDVIDRLLHALRRRHVDASAEGRSGLTGDPAVETILSALRLAEHPGHSAAVFHVLHSPLAAVIGLRSTAPSHVADVALDIRRRIHTRGLAAELAHWSHELAPSCSTASARRLLQLTELADRYEPDPSARLSPFIDAVDAASVEEASRSPVRLMTIHKSKGLEFDIVVLPQLNKVMGKVSAGAATVIRDPQTDEVLAVHRGTNKETRALHPELDAAYEQERLRRLRDDLSLLYVAMTRAIHALHLIAEPVKPTKAGKLSTKGVTDHSFAAVLRTTLGTDPEHEDVAGNCMLFTHGRPDWDASPAAASDDVRRPAASPPSPPRLAAASADGPRARRILSPSTLHATSPRLIDDLLSMRQDVARQRGTLIHAWCQCLEWTDEEAELTDERLHAVVERMQRRPAGAPDQMRQWMQDFRRMTRQPAIQSALERPKLKAGQSVELWRERPFAVQTGDQVLHGAFDRVVILHEKGRPASAVIIDYKTDDLTADSPAMQQRIERYRPQLNAYRSALASMLALPPSRIKARLLFLQPGVVVEM